MRSSNFPHEAIAVIDVVLQLGRQERKYPDAYWRTLPMEEHINSAKMHLTDFIYNTSPGEDHLAHALTRLAMAVSLRENKLEIVASKADIGKYKPVYGKPPYLTDPSKSHDGE